MKTKLENYSFHKDSLIVVDVHENEIHFSMYDNRSSVSYTCSKEELKGLADFIYETIGLSKKIQLTERNKLKIPPYLFDD
jgi:hypothetical protein